MGRRKSGATKYKNGTDRIAHLNNRDYMLFKNFSHSGCIGVDTAKGITSARRCTLWEKEGMIEKISHSSKSLREWHSDKAYRVTPKGKAWCNKTYGIDKWTKADPSTINHGTKVAEELSKLSVSEMRSLIHESEQKEWLQINNRDVGEETLKQFSAIDIVYFADNTQDMVCVEIITDNYGLQELTAHADSASAMGCDSYTTVKAG